MTSFLFALGIAAQLLFFVRTAWQWFVSERAGQVLIPAGYWKLSLLASLLLLAYAASTLDPVFVAGPVVSSLVFASNIRMGRRVGAAPPTPLSTLAPAGFLLAVLVGLGLSGKVRLFDLSVVPLGWVAIGACGQALWLSRNVVQWWASQRLGQSVLPASYFVVSTIGALLLLSYAIQRVDWVFMLAYAFNTIPYTRNLILLLREKKDEAPRNESATQAVAVGAEAGHGH